MRVITSGFGHVSCRVVITFIHLPKFSRLVQAGLNGLNSPWSSWLWRRAVIAFLQQKNHLIPESPWFDSGRGEIYFLLSHGHLGNLF